MSTSDRGSLRGKRVGIYARFSSDKQNASSADDQVARCRKLVTERGGSVPPKLCFKDAAISGASLQRPEFERMMGLVRTRELDVVVVEDPDRLSRDMADSAFLFKEMGFYDVELISASDGMSSLAPSAKTHFLLKGFMGEAFLDNLRDKTLRGQTARFNAGFATGAVAYGFCTTPKLDAVGQVLAHVISIDEAQATVVRGIFSEYLAGRSIALITAHLNAARVPPPRSKKRKGSPVWGDTTVRALLHNEVYAGVWRFARRRWTKVPGTNVRRPKPRSPSDAPQAQVRPQLRIIDEATWAEVQARLAAVRRHYVHEGSRLGSLHGKPTRYPFSGLLVCDHCGSLMYISGRGANRRYRCTGYAKRGVCTNGRSILEHLVRTRLLEGIRRVLTNDWGIAYARKVAALQSADRVREQERAVKDTRAELAKTEARIRTLIEQLADGGAAEYLRAALDELAAKAKALKAELSELSAIRTEPVQLPSPETIREWVSDLESFIDRDPLAGREYLRRLLKARQVRLRALPDGSYLAKSELLPMVMLTKTPPPAEPEGAVSSRHCGGRI